MVYTDNVIFIFMFIPSVIIIERFGIKTALLISVALAMIGSTFALLIDNMGAEIFGQLVIEAGFPMAVSCTTKIPARWFPYRERIFATSFVILAGLLGFTFGDASLEIFAGLRYAYALCILIVGGIAITLLLMLFKERPNQPPSESEARKLAYADEPFDLKQEVKSLFADSGFILAALASAFFITFIVDVQNGLKNII